MLKIFICPECYNIRMVSKRPNAVCLHCNEPLLACDLDYSEYILLTPEEREMYKAVYKEKEDKRESNTQESLLA